MPSKMLKLMEPAPTLGMNTVDDPNFLKPGECVRLLNMFPENPPLIRYGCPVVYKTFIDQYSYFLPPIIITRFKGSDSTWAIGWIYNTGTNKYYLVRVSPDGSDDIYQLGLATFIKPEFGSIALDNNIYVFASETFSSWDGAFYALGPKVVESSTVVRDMCITASCSLVTFSSASQVTPGGPFLNGDCFDYAFQYVRHTEATYFTGGIPISGLILPTGISGIPQRVDTFLPGACVGVESLATRQTIQITADNSYVVLDTGVDQTAALAQGATHIRVSRSARETSTSLAQGATHYFLADLPLGGGTFTDTVPDAALVGGELNFLLTGYSPLPAGGAYARFHLGRLFVMDSYGKVYYSEVPGGDGAYTLSTAEYFPQYAASLFKPLTYVLDCDQGQGILGSGIEILGSDIYFFKESQIYVLYGGDPTLAVPTLISGEIGCPFPQTIRKMDTIDRGQVIFFISTRGPCFIRNGGTLEIFSVFKVQELWPDRNLSIFGQIVSAYTVPRNSCTCLFYKNTIWIAFTDLYQDNKLYGYYSSPTNSAIKGALEVELAIPNLFGNIGVVDEGALTAYLFGTSQDYLVMTEFLKDGTFEDLETYPHASLIADFTYELVGA